MKINQHIILLSILLSIFSISVNCMERLLEEKRPARNMSALLNIAGQYAARQALYIYKNKGDWAVIEFLQNLNYESMQSVVKGLVNELITPTTIELNRFVFSERKSIIKLIFLIMRIYKNADFYRGILKIIDEKRFQLENKIYKLEMNSSEVAELGRYSNEKEEHLDIDSNGKMIMVKGKVSSEAVVRINLLIHNLHNALTELYVLHNDVEILINYV